MVFVNNVQEDPSNSCNYLKDFDAFYFTKRPRFSSNLVRQILFGPQDQSSLHSDWTGLFGMFSWYKDFFLTASLAVQLVAKLIDYNKNVYAESFNKELGRTHPEYLAQFCLEQMLCFDATKQKALVIVRQYISKRELTMKLDEILSSLIEND